MFINAILNLVYITAVIFAYYVTNKGIEKQLGKSTGSLSRRIICSIIFVMSILNTMLLKGNIIILFFCTALASLILCVNYEVSIIQKIKAVVIICCVPFIICVLLNLIFSSSIKIWIMYIIAYFLTYIIINVKDFMQVENILNMFVFVIYIIFLFTVSLIIGDISTSLLKSILIVVSVILIGVVIIYLYICINKLGNLKQENEILKQQNNSYRGQIISIRNDRDNIRNLGHDLKNHVTVLQELNNKKDSKRIKDYLEELNSKLVSVNDIKDYETIYDTGNFEFDAVVNKKLAECKRAGIKVDSKIVIPENIKIVPTDMASLVGNLFDNAIRAVSDLEANKKSIIMEAKYSKDIFYLKFSNAYEGEILYNEKGELATTKQDKNVHGIGMLSVKKVVEKYAGDLIINSCDNIFEVVVIMYPQINS